MIQKTLFGNENNINKTAEKELSKELETTSCKELDYLKENDKYGWRQLSDIDKKEEGVRYISFNIHISSDLDGSKRYISSSVTEEQPKGMLGSMWGGCDGFNPDDLENIQKFFDNMMDVKKEALKTVYREFTKEETNINYNHHNIYYYFRLIPAKNYFVIISDTLKDMIKKKGFDFEQWYEQYRALPENKATHEHWEKANEILSLLKQGDKIVGQLKKLNDVKNNRDVKDLTLFTLSEEEREKQLKELPLKLKEISDKIQQNEQFNGCHRYSKEFWFELKEWGKKW